MQRQYVVKLDDSDIDMVVNDEDLWNMDDHVGLIIPQECLKFSVTK